MITRTIDAVRRRWFRPLREYADEERILIYQMGKVGSMALTRALGDRGLHIHNFYPSNEPWPRRPSYGGSLARRLGHWLFYRAIRRGVRCRRRVKIVTLVRDPVARNVSMYFQDLPNRLAYYINEVKSNSRSREDIDLLVDCFRETFDQRYPLEWFDREMKRMTGVDVYAHPFDRITGRSLIEMDNTRVLVIQAERLRDNWAAVEEFCGRSLEWREDNRGDRKWYGTLYAEFLARFSLSPRELDEIYSSRYSRFFYSEEALAGFRQRWEGPKAAAAPFTKSTEVR
jgi:hypothetical protein